MGRFATEFGKFEFSRFFSLLIELFFVFFS